VEHSLRSMGDTEIRPQGGAIQPLGGEPTQKSHGRNTLWPPATP
jgi:hypothetical protein